jgi:hypothetical protein
LSSRDGLDALYTELVETHRISYRSRKTKESENLLIGHIDQDMPKRFISPVYVAAFSTP